MRPSLRWTKLLVAHSKSATPPSLSDFTELIAKCSENGWINTIDYDDPLWHRWYLNGVAIEAFRRDIRGVKYSTTRYLHLSWGRSKINHRPQCRWYYTVGKWSAWEEEPIDQYNDPRVELTTQENVFEPRIEYRSHDE